MLNPLLTLLPIMFLLHSPLTQNPPIFPSQSKSQNCYNSLQDSIACAHLITSLTSFYILPPYSLCLSHVLVLAILSMPQGHLLPQDFGSYCSFCMDNGHPQSSFLHRQILSQVTLTQGGLSWALYLNLNEYPHIWHLLPALSALVFPHLTNHILCLFILLNILSSVLQRHENRNLKMFCFVLCLPST